MLEIMRLTVEEDACEIFAGSSHWSVAMRDVGFAVKSFDILKDPSHDVCSKKWQQMLWEWIPSGRLKAIHLAPECTTWSLAAGHSYRDPQSLLGRADALASPRKDAIAEANECMRVVSKIVEFGCKKGCLISIENPWSSYIWGAEPLKSTLQSCGMRFSKVHYCAFGTKFQKRIAFCTNYPELFTRFCSSPCCGKRNHDERLAGKVFWRGCLQNRTKKGNPYPKLLCKLMAQSVVRACKKFNQK